jgi:RNA polymerase sigma-70 factor, ECF subfamily
VSLVTPSSVSLAALDGRETPDAAAVPLSEPPFSGAVRARVATAERTARLLREWFDLVWRALLRFGVPAEAAEDAAQEVFLIASAKLDRIDPTAERQFLYAVAVRIAANFRRSRGARREIPLDTFERELSADTMPDVLVEQKRAREILDRILDSMPEELRTAFVLFELEELTGPEVAEVLGVPLGTTASRLRRAREHYRTAIARLRRSFEDGGAP